MKTRNLVLTASLLGAGVLVWFCHGRCSAALADRDHTPIPAAPASNAETGTMPQIETADLAILPHAAAELSVYSLDMFTQVAFDRQGGPSHDTELVVVGELNASAPAAREDTKVWRAQLDIRSISGSQVPAGLREQMASPFAVRLTSDGQVAEIGVPMGMQAMALKLTRIIAAALQFSPSTKNESRSRVWTRRERDVVGQHLAKYERVSATKYKKRKSNYETLSGMLAPSQNVARGKDVAGEVEYEFSDSGQLLRVSGRDKLTVQFGNRTVSSEVGTGLQYRTSKPGRIELQEDQLVWFQLGEAAPRFEVASPSAGAPVSESVADLVTQIRSISTLPLDERRQALAQLGRKLRQEPGATTYIVDQLRHLQPGEVADSLLSALTDADTEEGRRAILSVAQDSTVQPEIRDSAIVQIGLDERASDETVQGLNDLVRGSAGSDLHSTAALALGTSIFHADQHPNSMGATAAARRTLTELLASSTDSGQRETYLQAIGNSGSAAAYGELSPYLSSADSSTRAAAYNALRRMPGDQVDTTLANAITNEQDPLVRNSALAAIMERSLTSTTATAISNVLRTDSSTGAHELIVRELGNKDELPAELVTTLQWVQSHDANVEVRRQAEALVKRFVATAAADQR